MATRRFTGNALAVAQVETITIGGTWSTGESLSVTINGKAITLTIGTATSTTAIATALAAAWNGDAVVGTESRNETGANIPEFKRITADDSGSTVVLTADDKGVPFTVSVAESSASGTISTTTTTAATGPKHLNNAKNWSGETLPTAGDDVVFSDFSGDVLYGLGSLTDALASLRIYRSFTGTIGLPPVNGTGSNAYAEYLTRYWTTAAAIIEIGLGDGPGSSRINLDTDTTTGVTVSVVGTGQPPEPGAFAVNLKGNPAAAANLTLEVIRGSVGFCLDAGTTGKVTPRIGAGVGSGDGDPVVSFGYGVTLGAVDMSGGTVTIRTATTAIVKTGGTLVIDGTGTHTTVDNNAGTLVYNSTGALGSTRIAVGTGGVLDFSRDMSAKTVSTAVKAYRGARIVDPHGVVSSLGVALQGCRMTEVEIVSKVGPSFTVT